MISPIKDMPRTAARLDDLPTEIIQKIYSSSSDIDAVLSLASTSHLFHNAFKGSQKLIIIEKVLESQFGPLQDIIQLVTYNASQPAHCFRQPGMSIALACQVVAVGRIAERWSAIYPSIRWREASDFRRHLRPQEVFRFRRALYRLWLYNRAFENVTFPYLELNPNRRGNQDDRVKFLRQFSNEELDEITELYDVFFEMVCHDLCPSDAMIQQRYNQGFPSKELLYFGSYETRTVFFRPDDPLRQKPPKSKLPSDMVFEAWGGYCTQMSKAKDIMKLTPELILTLREDLTCKAERVDFLKQQPDQFHDNPSTLRAALFVVAMDRDYELSEYDEEQGGIIDMSDEHCSF